MFICTTWSVGIISTTGLLSPVPLILSDKSLAFTQQLKADAFKIGVALIFIAVSDDEVCHFYNGVCVDVIMLSHAQQLFVFSVRCSGTPLLLNAKSTQDTNTDLTAEVRYSPEIADAKYCSNLAAKGASVKIGHDHKLANALTRLIVKCKYSPSAALADLRKKGWGYSVSLCAKTIYNYVNNGVLSFSRKDLPMHGKYKRRGRHKKSRRQKRASAGTSIDFRPQEINDRTVFANWEMDTVYTSKKDVYKPSLLVLTERMTRYELIFKMRDRTAGSVVRVLNALERSLGVQNFRKQYSSITVDNGSELADVERLEKSCRSVSRNRTKMYYCYSHQSWEHGSNENANKLIRRHFPKGTDFSQVSAVEIAEVQDWINHYPREILNWECSNTLFQQQLALL